MAEPRLLDLYETAYLAGGPDRVVDTAVVALVETGRVRVQRSGELSVVDDRPWHEVEAAVLAAVGPRGWRRIDMVRWKAGQDERLSALAERLHRYGLVSGTRPARRLRWARRPVALTIDGRHMLRRLRADPLASDVTTGTSAARVALDGPEQMTDREQRNAVFRPPTSRRRRRRSSGGGAADAIGSAYWAGAGNWADGSNGAAAGCGAGAGTGDGGSHGCGAGGCGGGGCGGG
jgi:hypothetical protein